MPHILHNLRTDMVLQPGIIQPPSHALILLQLPRLDLLAGDGELGGGSGANDGGDGLVREDGRPSTSVMLLCEFAHGGPFADWRAGEDLCRTARGPSAAERHVAG